MNDSAQHFVIFLPSGRRGLVPDGVTVHDAAHRLGADIESICGGRLTCHKCLVRVENGGFPHHQAIYSDTRHLSPARPDEEAFLNQLGRPDHRLACQARIQGDLLIFVPAASRAHRQIIRKSATRRVIALDPAIRQVYVQVSAARLGQHRGDWGRLQDALAAQWQLTNLHIAMPALRQLQAALRQQRWAVTVTLWQEKRVLDVQPGYVEGAYGLAVDVGTTTVAAYLCDLHTGDILATAADLNPQVAYGEDLMGRISYANDQRDGLTRLHRAIIKTSNALAKQAAQDAGLHSQQIHEAIFVGNTTMTHLLLGIQPRELGQAPFALATRDSLTLPAAELRLRLHPAAMAHVLPSQAGHIGADNVAVLLAEAPHQQDDTMLIVDVGTNAEIVLSNGRQLYSASSPTGPAFEGAQISHGMRAAPGAIERVRLDPETLLPRFRVIGEPRWSDEWPTATDPPETLPPAALAAGICGSGIIEAVAEMLMAGIVLPNGRFNPQSASPRLVWDGPQGSFVLATAAESGTGRPLTISQKDIRSIQLAKAALYAGARLLMDRAGVTTVDKIILAGAFGSTISPLHALVLGLIPDIDPARIYAVGNAAGDGARLALLNRQKRREAQTLAAQVIYVETAASAEFQDAFVQAIHMPHAGDAFPHVADRLPSLTAMPAPHSRRPRRRNT